MTFNAVPLVAFTHPAAVICNQMSARKKPSAPSVRAATNLKAAKAELRRISLAWGSRWQAPRSCRGRETAALRFTDPASPALHATHQNAEPVPSVLHHVAPQCDLCYIPNMCA